MGLKQFDPKHECKTKLRKGDEVVVLSGKSRGVVAKIDRIDRKKSRVYLEGKHFHLKHTKPSEASAGGIVEKPASIHISKVAVVDPETKKPTKIGYRKDGEDKVRFARKSGALIPNPQ
jgi:large subunit ribosomal protein L24